MKKLSQIVFAPLVATLVVFTFQTELHAQANDNFANATVISSTPFVEAADTTLATAEAGEPNHVPTFGNVASTSLWWSFTPTVDALVQVSSADANFDNTIAAYTGTTLASLVEVGGADDIFAGPEQFTFSATAGTTYHLALDGFSDVGTCNFTVELILAPPNDDFADFEALASAFDVSVDGTLVEATAEVDEPDHANTFFGNLVTNSVWYRWTAPSTEDAFFSVRGLIADPALAVYTGTDFNDLVEVGAADNSGDGGRETLALSVVSGTEYIIAVDAYSDEVQFISTPETFTLLVADAPDNDDFANPVDLGSAFPTGVITGQTIGASAEMFEPDHASGSRSNVASNSVWYTWQSPVTDHIRVSTVFNDGDSVIAVYTSLGDISLLTEVASADRGIAIGNESAFFDAVAGTDYVIAIDANENAGQPGVLVPGIFGLEIVIAPTNDHFENAVDFDDSTLPISQAGSTVGASSEFQYGEPAHAVALTNNLSSNSVWYRWVASASSEVSVSVTETSLDPVLSVYSGDDLVTLTEVASADLGFQGDPETVTFNATAGTAYWIAVDGWSNTGLPFAEGLGVFTLLIEEISSGDPYGDWIAIYPSLTGADAERNAMPQGDGVPNLVKLAHGLDPTVPAWEDANFGNLPRIVELAGGGAALEYTVVPGNLGTGVSAITHGGQTTGDYEEWDPAASLLVSGDVWLIVLPAGTEGGARVVVTDPSAP